MMMKINTLILVFVVLIGLLGASKGSKLTPNFYKHSCEEAETIVKKATEKHVASNPAVPARLLRMHFHDCFVRGCDGSVLLNSTKKDAEKDAVPNQTLLGFDVIDDIKAQVEKKCPGIVSCADILALAARDSVLYNFTGKGDQDPSLDKNYAKLLKTKCPPNDKNTTVQMDPGSALKFDSSYYGVVLKHKGLFTSDAALVTNKVARNTVQELVYQNDFFLEFALSMKKMGAIEVLTGTAGEIRKKCWTVNS
ncbi:hypothetical protein CsatA_000221 [Cannabis sativa]